MRIASRGIAINVILCLVTAAATILCADGLFRAYEHWSAEGTVESTDVIDLHALNYNDSAIRLDKPADEFRVLSLGDSFAYGIVAYPYSYAGIAASALSSRLRRSVRILNLGEPNTSAYDYITADDYWAQRLAPDAVIVTMFIGNDLLDIAFHYTPTTWVPNRVFEAKSFNIVDGSPRSFVPHRFPLRMLDYAYALYLSRTLRIAPAVNDERYNIAAAALPEDNWWNVNTTQLVNFQWQRRDELAAGYRGVAELVRHLSRVRTSGRKVLLLLAPAEPQVDGKLWKDLLARVKDTPSAYDRSLPDKVVVSIRDVVDANVPVIALRPELRCRTDNGATFYQPLNTHWNVEGNALVGQLVADAVATMWFGDSHHMVTPCSEESSSGETNGIRDEEIRAWVAKRILSDTDAQTADVQGQK